MCWGKGQKVFPDLELVSKIETSSKSGKHMVVYFYTIQSNPPTPNHTLVLPTPAHDAAYSEHQ